MKKILITSFAVAAMAIGGGVFAHTALTQSDPILEANVEALARGEELQLPCKVSKSHTCFVLGRDAHGNLINMTIKGMKNIFK